jgi:hypothetical protein
MPAEGSEPAALVEWIVTTAIGDFNIRAKWFCDSMVTTYEAAGVFDEWLIGLANQLFANAQECGPKERRIIPKERIISELKIHLRGAVEYWRSESLRVVREGEGQKRAQHAAPPLPAEHGGNPTEPNDELLARPESTAPSIADVPVPACSQQTAPEIPSPRPPAPAAASAPKSRGGRPEGGPVDGKRLRELRERIIPFVSQAAFGEKCNPPLSEDTVQRAERGDAVDKRTADILVNVLVDLGYPKSTAEAIRKPQ